MRKLVEAVGDDAKVVSVRCQKICKGPVIGLRSEGTLEWFSRVHGKELRDAVIRSLRKGRMVKALKAHREKKRAGRCR